MKTQLNTPLFEGQTVRLTVIDPEKDAAVESAWTYRLEYAQWLRDQPARPLAAFELKRIYEEHIKKANQTNNSFFFAVRLTAGNRLIGFLRIPWVSWNTGAAPLQLFLGETGDLNQYGHEALNLALSYMFDELNLHHVHTTISSGDGDSTAFYEMNGFKLEVRLREAIFRGGRYFDRLTYGLLRPEWEARMAEAS